MFCTLPSSSRGKSVHQKWRARSSSQCSVHHNTCGVEAIFVAVEREGEGKKGGRKAPLYEPRRRRSQRGSEESTQAAAGGGRTGRERGALPTGFLVRMRRWAAGNLRHHSGLVKKPGSTLKSPVRRPERWFWRGRGGRAGSTGYVWSVGLCGSPGLAAPIGRSGRPQVLPRWREGAKEGGGEGGAPNREEEKVEGRGALLSLAPLLRWMVRLP